MIKKRGNISIEWLYLALFVLFVTLLLVVVVPDEAWPPSIKERFIEKVDIKKIKLPKFIKDPDNCNQMNEIECIADKDKGCIPTYATNRELFLECKFCPEFPRCEIIKNEDACNKELCNLNCKWIDDKTSIIGKCIKNNEDELNDER